MSEIPDLEAIPLTPAEIAELHTRWLEATQAEPKDGDPFSGSSASPEWISAYYGSRAARFNLHIEHVNNLGRLLATIAARDATISALRAALREAREFLNASGSLKPKAGVDPARLRPLLACVDVLLAEQEPPE
jgi:hypothetical protein